MAISRNGDKSSHPSEPFLSVVIPNRNGKQTIGTCLEALFSSSHGNFEVIVVDDGSTDGSADIIRKFPCTLIELDEHSGASRARNEGAHRARGDALFFIDADCVVLPDTLDMVERAYRDNPDALIGGTYTPLPYDRGFFSTFQSVFINYSETKRPEPDYVATHAMVISRGIFGKSGGFDEDFMPIIEDVEFSHRMRRMGVRLVAEPEIMVRHVFNFNLARSLKNAARKSMYWTMYSLRNRDLLADSGTASLELKANTLAWPLCAALVLAFAAGGGAAFLAAALSVLLLNLLINRRFIAALLKAGPLFALMATAYYTAVYPLAVGTGGLMGALRRG